MSKVFTTTLRLNSNNEDDRRALAYLQGRDRKKYKSYSSAVVAAVNDFFFRQEQLVSDPFLETRERQEAFLQEVRDTIRDSLQTSGTGLGALATLLQGIPNTAPTKEIMSDEPYDTAMEFINGL